MKKNLLVAVVAYVSLLPQLGFAGGLPGWDLAKSRAISKQLSRVTVPNRVSDDCADFTGNWVGKCSVGDESNDSTVDIKQAGCSSLTLGGESYHIGALDSVTEANPNAGKPYAVTGALAIDWNPQQTELHTIGTGFFKSLGTPTNVALAAQGTMSLVAGKLLSEIEVLGFKVKCVYDKH